MPTNLGAPAQGGATQSSSSAPLSGAARYEKVCTEEHSAHASGLGQPEYPQHHTEGRNFPSLKLRTPPATREDTPLRTMTQECALTGPRQASYCPHKGATRPLYELLVLRR